MTIPVPIAPCRCLRISIPVAASSALLQAECASRQMARAQELTATLHQLQMVHVLCLLHRQHVHEAVGPVHIGRQCLGRLLKTHLLRRHRLPWATQPVRRRGTLYTHLEHTDEEEVGLHDVPHERWVLLGKRPSCREAGHSQRSVAHLAIAPKLALGMCGRRAREQHLEPPGATSHFHKALDPAHLNTPKTCSRPREQHARARQNSRSGIQGHVRRYTQPQQRHAQLVV